MELDPPQQHLSSAPPPAPTPASTSMPPPTPTETGAAFIEALRDVGLLGDLTEGLLMALLERLPPTVDEDVRRVALMRLYYVESPSDGGVARQTADRFVIHAHEDRVSARDLVARIERCTPEIAPMSLERIGTDDGPLVIRAPGDAFSAVNEHEDDLDTDEIDLTELDAAPSVSVRALVRAVNILLDRKGVSERFVLLCADGQSECYVCVGLSDAQVLREAGHLGDDDEESVLDLGAWGRG